MDQRPVGDQPSSLDSAEEVLQAEDESTMPWD